MLLQSQTSEAVRKSKEDLDTYKEHYDNLLAEDKVRATVSPTHQCHKARLPGFEGRLEGI